MMKKLVALFMTFALLLASGLAYAADVVNWNCPQCGTDNTGNFCTECGAKKPETIVCSKCGEVYPVETSYKFCGNCGAALVSAMATSFPDEPGFDSPDAALISYVDGLKQQNIEQMLSAFGWKTQASHMSFKLTIDRMQVYNTTVCPALPEGSKLSNSLNAEVARSRAANYLRYALTQLVLPTVEDISMPISIKKDYESTDAFIETAIDMSRLELLSSITDIKVYTPEESIKEGLLSENYLNERNQANLEKYRLMYGADELVDRMITFRMGQELYGFAPFVARFGDRWYLYSMSGMGAMIMGVSPMSAAFFSITQMMTK